MTHSPLVLEEDDRYTGWMRPIGWRMVNLARCRGCGLPISWAYTPLGRAAPLNRDGISHFATCAEVERFRKRRAVR